MDKILTVYFSADGRMRRLPYFLWHLGIIFVYVLMGIAFNFVIPEPEQAQSGGSMDLIIAAVVILFVIVLTFASFVLVIKRFHDLDKSGWWSLLMLVPFLNFLGAIYLLFFRGTDGPNRFGPPPV